MTSKAMSPSLLVPGVSPTNRFPLVPTRRGGRGVSMVPTPAYRGAWWFAYAADGPGCTRCRDAKANKAMANVLGDGTQALKSVGSDFTKAAIQKVLSSTAKFSEPPGPAVLKLCKELVQYLAQRNLGRSNAIEILQCKERKPRFGRGGNSRWKELETIRRFTPRQAGGYFLLEDDSLCQVADNTTPQLGLIVVPFAYSGPLQAAYETAEYSHWLLQAPAKGIHNISSNASPGGHYFTGQAAFMTDSEMPYWVAKILRELSEFLPE